MGAFLADVTLNSVYALLWIVFEASVSSSSTALDYLAVAMRLVGAHCGRRARKWEDAFLLALSVAKFWWSVACHICGWVDLHYAIFLGLACGSRTANLDLAAFRVCYKLLIFHLELDNVAVCGFLLLLPEVMFMQLILGALVRSWNRLSLVERLGNLSNLIWIWIDVHHWFWGEVRGLTQSSWVSRVLRDQDIIGILNSLIKSSLSTVFFVRTYLQVVSQQARFISFF